MATTGTIVAIRLVRTTHKRARATASLRRCGGHTQGYARLKRNVGQSGQKGTNLASWHPQNSPFYLICLSGNVEVTSQCMKLGIADRFGHFDQLSHRGATLTATAAKTRCRQLLRLALRPHGDRLERNPIRLESIVRTGNRRRNGPGNWEVA